MTKPPKLSANISMLFTEYDFPARIEAAARAGFAAVEAQFPYAVPARELKQRADDVGLAFNHINASAGRSGEFGLGALPGRQEDFLRTIEQALDYARVLGCLTIHCMSGCVAPEDRAAARDTFLANFERASEMARDTGVALVIEPLNAHDRPGYFLSRSDEVVELLGVLGRGNVKLLFDLYHIQISEGDLTRRLERHWPFIGHIQFASVPHRHEPDEGEIAYAAMFGEIARHGWQGYLGAEYRPRGRTGDGLAWMRTLMPQA